jgi:hypothetical protein
MSGSGTTAKRGSAGPGEGKGRLDAGDGPENAGFGLAMWRRWRARRKPEARRSASRSLTILAEDIKADGECTRGRVDAKRHSRGESRHVISCNAAIAANGLANNKPDRCRDGRCTCSHPDRWNWRVWQVCFLQRRLYQLR